MGGGWIAKHSFMIVLSYTEALLWQLLMFVSTKMWPQLAIRNWRTGERGAVCIMGASDVKTLVGWTCKRISCNILPIVNVCQTQMPSLKRKCRHFDEIFITGCTGSCHFDNFQCSQWWKFHQNEDISVSVLKCVLSVAPMVLKWRSGKSLQGTTWTTWRVLYPLQCNFLKPLDSLTTFKTPLC